MQDSSSRVSSSFTYGIVYGTAFCSRERKVQYNRDTSDVENNNDVDKKCGEGRPLMLNPST